MILLLAATFIAALGHLGYLGGPVFVDFAADARPAGRLEGITAVFLSGDMGLNVGMGRAVARRLAANGVFVVGVNTLTYFRKRRTPRETEALLAAAMRRALAVPGTRRVVLIGQSFGADMLQARLPSLPAASRSRVPMVALIVPGRTIEYRASPSDLFGLESPEVDALPTARHLGWTRTLCIQGAEETDSLCPLLGNGVGRVALPGGHLLRYDSERVARVLLNAMLAAAPPRRG